MVHNYDDDGVAPPPSRATADAKEIVNAGL